MQKWMKQWLCFLLSLTLALPGTGIPVYAAETAGMESAGTADEAGFLAAADGADSREAEETDKEAAQAGRETAEIPDSTEYVVNPLYEDVLNVEDLKAEIDALQDGQDETAGSAQAAFVYTSLEAAAEYVRGEMVKRSPIISFTVPAYLNGLYESLSKEIVDQACADTEDCSGQEGDALQWGRKGYQVQLATSAGNLTLTYTMSYHTTQAQEEELTQAVGNALSGLALDGKTQYEKIRLIHDYICDHVDYDDTYTKYSAYDALCTGTAVCQGYAVLFYRMCKDAGLSVRLVSGTGNGGAHGWNIVKIGQKYYNIDCTWDGQEDETYHDWFLKGETDFPDHTRDEEYDTDEFHAAYPMSDSSYTEGSGEGGGEDDRPAPLNKPNQRFFFTSLDAAEGEPDLASTAQGRPKVLIFFRTTCSISQGTIRSIAGGSFPGVDIYAIEIAEAPKEAVSSFKASYAQGNDSITFAWESNAGTAWNYYLNEAEIFSGTLPCICYIDANDKFQHMTTDRSSASAVMDNLRYYCGYDGSGSGGEGGDQPVEGIENPYYSFTALDGSTVSSTANGRPRLLMFFRTTCGYSQAAIRSIAGQEFPGVDLYALEADGKEKDEVVTFKNSYGNDDITFCYDASGRNGSVMWAYYRLMNPDASGNVSVTFPLIFYIDAENKLRHMTMAYCSADTVKQNLEQYCGYSGGSSEPSEPTYTVRFDLNGHGTPSPAYADRTDIASGSRISEPAQPQADGYTFAGWYKEPACVNAWDFSTDTVGANLTLYAGWRSGSAEDISNPALSFKTINDETVTSTANGRPKLLLFFRTGCLNCKNTIRALAAETNLGADLYALELESLGKDEVAAFKETWGGDNIQFCYDTSGGISSALWQYYRLMNPDAESLRVTTPAIFYINADNKLKHMTQGNCTADMVKQNLQQYCNAGGGEPVEPSNPDYTVRFNLNGHGTVSDTYKDRKAKKGSKINKPADPRDSEFKFAGWYKDASCTNIWRFKEDTVEGDVTLYANWKHNPVYAVTFNLNGSNVVFPEYEEDYKYIEKDTTIDPPENSPVRDGYAFGGWYKEARCTTPWDFASDTITGSTTLYAKWRTVLQGITLNKTALTLKTGSTSQLTAALTPSSGFDPSPISWMSSDETVAAAAANETNSKAATVTAVGEGSCVITAESDGKQASCLVQVTADGKSAPIVSATKVTGNDQITWSIDSKGKLTVSGKGEIRTGASSRLPWAGYEERILSAKVSITEITDASGLFLGCTNLGEVDISALKTNKTTDISRMFSGCQSLTKLDMSRMDISKATNADGIFQGCTNLGYIRTPSKVTLNIQLPGNTDDAWCQDDGAVVKTKQFPKNISRSIILTKNRVVTFTVTLDRQEKGENTTLTGLTRGSKVEKPEDPAAEGFLFKGWFKDAEFQTPWNFETDTVDDDITLYAQWAEARAVSFDLQGKGTPLPEYEEYKSVEKGTAIQKPADPEAEGYIFTGWYKEAECTTPWDFAKDTVEEDTVLYAGWEPEVHAFTVTFDLQGKGTALPEYSGENYQNLEKGSTVKEPASPMDDDYTFTGWYKEETCENLWDFEKDTVEADVTLYAGWVKSVGEILPEDMPSGGKVPDGLWAAPISDTAYTGKAIKPAVHVYWDKERLVEGLDYTVKYKNNTKASTGSKPATITITGKKSYKGKKELTFRITPVDLADVTADDIAVAYNKKTQKKIPTVSWCGKKLANKKDFTVTWPDGGSAYREKGEYSILLTAKNGSSFTGTRTVKLSIVDPKELTLMSKVKVKKLPSQVYTGNPAELKKGSLRVSFKGNALSEGTDYSILSYENNLSAGTATVVLQGMKKYAGTKRVTFQITAYNLKTGSGQIGGLKDPLEAKLNNGKAKPKPTLAFNGQRLVEGKDYSLSYKNNTRIRNAGDKKAPTVVIKGKGNFKGTLTKTFTITE